jgi:four helix bundle protein
MGLGYWGWEQLSAGDQEVANPKAVSSFRDLRVWQAAMDLVTAVYQLTQTFPREETYGLTGQMRRAAVSVPSNIAEGHAREHLREYLHHLSIAQGSLAELETQIEIAHCLGYTAAAGIAPMLVHVTSIAKQLKALRVALERRLPLAATQSGRGRVPPVPKT